MKTIKNVVLITFLTWIVSSCYPTIDDTKASCTENCTVFTGKVETFDHRGISGVEVLLNYKYPSTFLSSKTRKIAKVKTDGNGEYRISAFLKDEELGDSTRGYFTLRLDTDMINRKISHKAFDEYLKPNEMLVNGYARVVFHTVEDRSFTFDNSFIVPQKGTFKIKLRDFNPVLEDDYFKASVHYSYTFLGKGWGATYPWGGVKAYAVKGSNPTEVELSSVVGDSTRVQIEKRKNGVTERVVKYVKLEDTSPYEMEFSY